MPYFVLVRKRGSSWDWSVPMRSQQLWPEHAAYMDALADEGFVAAGGPLGHEDEAARVLHVIRAPDAATIERRLDEDPWTPSKMLETVSIEPWNLLLGSLDRRH
jgi:uncharacterized protein YciI